MLSRRAAIGGMVGGLAAAALPRIARCDSPLTLDGADVHVEGYPTVAAARWIGDELQRATGGRLRLRLYHAGQLGREADTLSLVRHGALALTRVTLASLNNAFPATTALSLPYVFDDVSHLRQSLDGAPGAAVLRSFEARGLVGLCFYDAGVRSVYNTRHPVVSPGDLKGLKLRVPPSDLFMALMQGFGVNATPLAYGEVYSALQTGLIDGAENNWLSFHSSRQFEVARYWSETLHSMVPDVLLLSARADALLAADDRELLRDLAQRSVSVMRELWDQRIDAARSAALASGVKVNAADLDAFRAAARPMVSAQLAAPGMRLLHDQIRALAVSA